MKERLKKQLDAYLQDTVIILPDGEINKSELLEHLADFVIEDRRRTLVDVRTKVTGRTKMQLLEYINTKIRFS